MNRINEEKQDTKKALAHNNAIVVFLKDGHYIATYIYQKGKSAIGATQQQALQCLIATTFKK